MNSMERNEEMGARVLKRLASLAIVLLFFCFCTPKEEKVEKIVDDGVEVILNHIEPYKLRGEPSTFDLIEEYSIDFARDDIGEMGIADATDFEIDSESNIYFTHSHKDEDLVFKFDITGNFISSFGRKGQGPGEIQFILHSGIDSQDNLIISDHVNKKMLFFSKEGKLSDEIRYPLNVWSIFPLENGKYIASWRKSDPSADYFWEGISLFDSSFKEIKILDKHKYPSPIKKGYRGVNINPFFIRYICNEHIYIGNENRGYEILIFDLDGNPARKIRKEYTPIKVPSDLINERKERYKKTPLKLWFPEYYLPICDFLPDDEGRLYVMTFEKGDNEGEFWYDIFNPEGIFVGRKSLKILSEGEIVAYAQVRRNRLYCFEENEEGFRVFKVYKMIWK